jgi:ketosteroid isomerase-like protein
MTSRVTTEVDLVALFAAIDGGDVEGASAFMHHDVVLRFGNRTAIHGIDAFRNLFAEFKPSIAGIRHELLHVWTATEDAAVRVVLSSVHYTRLDGKVVSVPCCNVFRLSAHGITEYQVFLDMTPVFATDAP